MDQDRRSCSMRPADDRRRAVARTIGDASWSSPIGIRALLNPPRANQDSLRTACARKGRATGLYQWTALRPLSRSDRGPGGTGSLGRVRHPKCFRVRWAECRQKVGRPCVGGRLGVPRPQPRQPPCLRIAGQRLWPAQPRAWAPRPASAPFPARTRRARWTSPSHLSRFLRRPPTTGCGAGTARPAAAAFNCGRTRTEPICA